MSNKVNRPSYPLKNPDTPDLDKIFLRVYETWQMWAVQVLGKDSQFCQETRDITAAARPWCADGEGCDRRRVQRGRRPSWQCRCGNWHPWSRGRWRRPGAMAQTVGSPDGSRRSSDCLRASCVQINLSRWRGRDRQPQPTAVGG